MENFWTKIDGKYCNEFLLLSGCRIYRVWIWSSYLFEIWIGKENCYILSCNVMHSVQSGWQVSISNRFQFLLPMCYTLRYHIYYIITFFYSVRKICTAVYVSKILWSSVVWCLVVNRWRRELIHSFLLFQLPRIFFSVRNSNHKNWEDEPREQSSKLI